MTLPKVDTTPVDIMWPTEANADAAQVYRCAPPPPPVSAERMPVHASANQSQSGESDRVQWALSFLWVAAAGTRDGGGLGTSSGEEDWSWRLGGLCPLGGYELRGRCFWPHLELRHV